MTILKSSMLEKIKVDLDEREEIIRQAVYEVSKQLDAPDLCESIVVTYFVWSHSLTPYQVGKEICYHMTSGVRHAPQGSLLDSCTGKIVDSIEFDNEKRCGLVRIAFPLKMLLDSDGNIYSTDILHIVAGAGILALCENRDAKVVDIAMSDEIIEKFPGPAYGSPGLRKLTDFGDRIAFGTILKPCTGITPDQEAQIAGQAASNPLFMFIKEDENYLPGVDFSPISTRAGKAVEAVRQAKSKRGGVGIIFATNITSPPQIIMDNLKRALDAGVNGVMFSEYYSGGTVRAVREFTRNMDTPPAIYGHNGGITARTRHIYREVLDRLARLDGMDFRQTAPLTAGRSLLRPYGLEWRKCEEMLTKPLGSKPPVMIARAGGLDQGNIIQNLLDIEKCGDVRNYLFLAGSAINTIKDEKDNYAPSVGAKAMEQAVEIYRKMIFSDISSCAVDNIRKVAEENSYYELVMALDQRYGK